MGFAALFFVLFAAPAFFVAGSLLLENGGMMSEPLSALATAGFGDSFDVDVDADDTLVSDT